MPDRKELLLTILLFGIYSAKLNGQIVQHFFHHLDQSEGLSELRNSYISDDSKGYIWLGGFDGLNRFDGKTVKVYRPTLPNGSYSPNITSKVMEGKDGKLWFSSSSALHFISTQSESISSIVLKDPNGLLASNSEHVLLHLDQESRLWVVAQDWLHLYDTETGRDSLVHPLNTFSCYPILHKSGRVTGLLNLLAAEGGGIEIFEYDQNEVKKSSWFTGKEGSGIPKAFIQFAQVEGDSLIWLPSDIGLIRFPINYPKGYTVFKPHGLPIDVKFNDVCSWKDEFLFASSSNYGLFLFDKRLERKGFVFNWPSIQQNDAIKRSNINNVFVGKTGTLWLSIWDEGIFFINLEYVKFQVQEQIPSGQSEKQHTVTSVIEDKEGNTWTASADGKVTMKTAGDKLILQSSNIKTGSPDRLFCDSEGDIWAFNGTTVFLKKRNTNGFYKIARNLNRLNKIVQLSPNDFLFICPIGVYKYNKFMPLINYAGVKPLLTHENIFDAFLDHDERLFLSDEVDKLWVYKPNGLDFSLEQEISGVGYSSGMAANKNIRWFASNKGLLKLDINDFSIEFVKGKDRVLEKAFNAILQDHHQNLWLSSNSGLYKYNPSTHEVIHYTESDGLQGLQFMLGSACKLSDGRLAFGGVNGLNIFHPDSVRDNPNPPILHFTDWIVNDTGSISTSPEFLPRQSFSYENRTLSFHFVGIDYTAPDEVKYRYRLKGFEKDTAEGGTNGFARYAQLPAGDYTFQVWAANSDGVWTTVPHELQFTIEPPWYATWWARSVQILLVLGLLYAFYRNRIAQIRRKESERRKEAEFRQKEAESKQLAAELQNSVLRLQMNPHFIFNSMNSISSYILQKDIDTANNYLSRFAKLMRLILDLASKRLIPITDEIELLEQYMAAEAMRFENKFSWQFELDEALDPEETLLPTMILQPFVENAIWHGFSRKTTAGHVIISIKKEGDYMVCTVQDNGIGRIESSKNKSERQESKAVQITEERLRLIQNKGFSNTKLTILDLYDDEGLPTGTKVEVRLPLSLI